MSISLYRALYNGGEQLIKFANPGTEMASDRKSANIQYSASVQAAIDKLMPTDDPLYRGDFDVVAHINSLFPTEQSLSSLDETIVQIEGDMGAVCADMAELVHAQSSGQADNQEARASIGELFERMREMKSKTDVSQTMVAEITRDIKQLDTCKRNLTQSIAALHHLHILLDGGEHLGEWAARRDFEKIDRELPAILNVLQLFEPYQSVPQVAHLCAKVRQQRTQLGTQVVDDFKTCVQEKRTRSYMHAVCRVAVECSPTLQTSLCAWYIEQQLREYALLFDDAEDCAWLDQIDSRYAWISDKLVTLEQSNSLSIFPADWQMLRRIAYQWCTNTRQMLGVCMGKRSGELHERLLSHAIKHTIKFEQKLCRRFPTSGGDSSSPSSPVDASFVNVVRVVFDDYVHVFVAAYERNMSDFVDQCVKRFADGVERPQRSTSTTAHPIPSAVNLFKFYKRLIVDAADITTDPRLAMHKLGPLLRKYLRVYADKCLVNSLPNRRDTTASSTNQHSSVQSAVQSTASKGLTAAMSYAATGHLLQSLLKEEGAATVPRLSLDEQFIACCVLATADWCAQTTQQLHAKLKEKFDKDAETQASVDMSSEQEYFNGVTAQSLAVLAMDMEASCDAALLTMNKINWLNVDAVGDESPYVKAMCGHLKATVPRLRDYLADRRKYFAHLCLKFVQQLLIKYVSCVYRCKPCSINGAEQLLLDAHTLKTFLLVMPCVDSRAATQPPQAYTRLVDTTMSRVEMLFKIIMTPVDDVESFIDHYRQLLPDSDATELQKVLLMKQVFGNDQAVLIERYRHVSTAKSKEQQQSTVRSPADALLSLAEQDSSRIHKLQQLVNRRL